MQQFQFDVSIYLPRVTLKAFSTAALPYVTDSPTGWLVNVFANTLSAATDVCSLSLKVASLFSVAAYQTQTLATF